MFDKLKANHTERHLTSSDSESTSSSASDCDSEEHFADPVFIDPVELDRVTKSDIVTKIETWANWMDL